MDNSNPLVEARLQKISKLKRLGIDVYPAVAFNPSHSVPQALSAASELISEQQTVRIAGRVIAQRDMGKAVFFDLLDEGQKIQTYFRQSDLDEGTWKVLELIDLGDFVGVDGIVFRTRSGEVTVGGRSMMVLCKASEPIPLAKRSGDQAFNLVNDKGLLYRHRHIDLLVNPESRTLFQKRSRIIRGIRQYLDEQGFLEVETPILGLHYSGAAARPFVTRINALDQQMYLRISPECALKRLLCGGFNKVYELGKNFRNEGIDANHNPEFTMLEWYEAYSDYFDQMVRFETLVARLCEEVNGTIKIEYRGRPLDLSPPWRRIPMLEALDEVMGIDIAKVPLESLSEVFQQHHPAGTAGLPEPLTWGAAVIELFESLVEPGLWDPVFITDYPAEVSPLTKRHRDNPRLVERFEPMIAGMEVGNSYSELNDPVEQYDRLVSQQVARDQAYDMDEDFVQAINHGMPPAGGTGVGVDRIVMILTGAESIRDVVFFPFVSRQDVDQYKEPPETMDRQSQERGTA
jgi:lysyl-tRNA synthetase, class II